MNKDVYSFINDIELVDDSEIEKREQEERERQEKTRRAKLESDYKLKSNVPERYKNESLETYKPIPENEKIYKWLLGFCDAVDRHKNKKNLIYLSGSFGTGKTHLGCGLIRRLGGMILTSMELCITYDSCRDFNAPQTRIQFLKSLCRSKVLVIDEVGKGIASIEEQILPYILNEFYGNGNILLFLGNISQADFKRIIGGAGTDRFEEVGLYLTLTGESMRKKT